MELNRTVVVVGHRVPLWPANCSCCCCSWCFLQERTAEIRCLRSRGGRRYRLIRMLPSFVTHSAVALRRPSCWTVACCLCARRVIFLLVDISLSRKRQELTIMLPSGASCFLLDRACCMYVCMYVCPHAVPLRVRFFLIDVYYCSVIVV